MPRSSAARAFDTAYEGAPSWETGRPQPVVARLLAAGRIAGRVLDAGCGTGSHAVLLAEAGHPVVGLDIAAAAVGRARSRAAGAGVAAEFAVGDALALASLASELGAPFDTVLDVGLFHVLQPADREPYAAALSTVVRPGGSALVVAWSDRNPFGIGPARVRRRDLRAAFRARSGWRVVGVEAAELETRLLSGRVNAWLLCAARR